MRLFFILGTALLLGSSPAASAVKVKWNEQAEGAVAAVPLEKSDPVFPPDALDGGDDQWVRVSYLIKKDGTTTDILILDPPSKPSLEMAAREAVAGWTFKPAQLQTYGSEQGIREEWVHFIHPNSQSGLEPRKAQRIMKALVALETGNTSDISLLASLASATKDKNLVTRKYTEFLKGINRVEGKNNWEKMEAFHYFENYLHLSDLVDEQQPMPDSMMKGLALQHSIILGFTFNKPTLILERFQQLDDHYGGLAEDNAIVKAVTDLKFQLDDQQNGRSYHGQVIGNCEDCRDWIKNFHHTLYSDTFEIRNVTRWRDKETAKITKLRLLCDYYTEEMNFRPGRPYHATSSTGTCDLYVEGTPGTEFDIIEYPIGH